jgi:hypothetical protein
LYDPTTAGCRDGLEASGVNENQGAESTVSFLLALLAMFDQAGAKTHGGHAEAERDEPRDVLAGELRAVGARARRAPVRDPSLTFSPDPDAPSPNPRIP